MAETKTEVEVKREEPAPLAGQERPHPFVSLRNEINRLFEDFDWPDFRFPRQRRVGAPGPLRTWSDVWAAAPAIDLVERDGEYEIQAELPGLDIKDVEVKLNEGILTIRGTKSAEHSEENQNYYLRERSYGEFQRSFRLPGGINPEKVEAGFENGVLKVHLPKTAEAKQKERKIEVKSA